MPERKAPAPPTEPARKDASFMRLALKLAARGKGSTSPNPPVGAVAVFEGKVVGSGWHQRAGLPHAEVEALSEAKSKASGATLYVTLEPCNHHGKTPPCTEAIIAAGVKRVVFGQHDPNPGVTGGGASRLSESGLEVQGGVLEDECARFNEAWTKWVASGMPFGVLKAAASLDGKIATHSGDSKWISSEESRKLVHLMRAESDAILVGINTALTDDPQLTCRLPGGKSPIRVVVDSRLRLGSRARMFSCPGQTMVATTRGSDPMRRAELEKVGGEVLELPRGAKGVDLRALFEELGKRGIVSVLIEGGGEINASALSAGLVDKLCLFMAPRIIGGREAPGVIGGEGVRLVAEAPQMRVHEVKRVGPDLMLVAYPLR